MSGSEEKEGIVGRIGHGLKDWFTGPEGAPTGDETVSTHEGVPVVSPNVGPSNVPLSMTPGVTMAAQEDPETVKELEGLLGQRPTYAKLLEKLGLLTVFPDEATRFTAALAILKGDGLSKAMLLAELDECLGLLDSKLRDFLATADQRRTENASTAHKQIEANTAATAGHQAEIQRLTEEIQRLNTESAGLQRQIVESDLVISRGVAAYRASDDTVRQGLATVRNKVAACD